MTPKLNPKRHTKGTGGRSRSVDSGWAWMVCLGCHVSQMLVLGYFASLGVIYLEWKEYFDTTATASSWLVSVPWLVFTPTIQVVGVIAQRVGARPLSMVGATLNALGTILGSLSKDLWHLYLTNALSGFGAAIVATSGFVVLSRYFKRHYAFANGIALVGVNVGQMLFPPLMRLLVAHYGWRGTMLIIGAVQMHAAAACVFFRPLETSLKTNPEQNDSEAVVMDVLPGTGNTKSEIGIDTCQECPKTVSTTKGHIGLKSLAFLRPLTNVRFTLVVISIMVYSMGWIAAITHSPARAKEAGWNEDQGAALLTVYGIIAMISRSTHGWIVDRKYIGAFKFILTVLLCAAVATLLNPVSDSYVFLITYMVAIGMFLGIAGPLYFVVARKFVGEAGFASAVSWMLTSFSLANGTGSVIAGKLFDGTGNYVATFLCIGGLFAVSFLLVGAAVILEEKQKLLQKRRPTHSGNEAGSAEQL